MKNIFYLGLAAITLFTTQLHAQSWVPGTGGYLQTDAATSAVYIPAGDFFMDHGNIGVSGNIGCQGTMSPSSGISSAGYSTFIAGMSVLSGDINVSSGNVNINSGNLFVGGNTTLNTLTVTGISNFNSYVTIGSGMPSPNGGFGNYNLYVTKGILTEKVNVAVAGSANWADFVFNTDYNLMPLSKVESYINTNKHLPEIPAATEVVKDGVDVAKMDAKLLQKVEELTLYIIQQQKDITEQQKEIDELKKKLNN